MRGTGVGRAFVTRFESTCALCYAFIDEGDDAGWIDDQVVCGECHESEAEEREW